MHRGTCLSTCFPLPDFSPKLRGEAIAVQGLTVSPLSMHAAASCLLFVCWLSGNGVTTQGFVVQEVNKQQRPWLYRPPSTPQSPFKCWRLRHTIDKAHVHSIVIGVEVVIGIGDKHSKASRSKLNVFNSAGPVGGSVITNACCTAELG